MISCSILGCTFAIDVPYRMANHFAQSMDNNLNTHGITLLFQKMAEEDALHAFQHECGVCADYPHARGWRGLILNGMFDSLFDIYKNVETSKELWDTLEAKYMAEDASKLGSHLRIKESLKVQDSDKPKGNNVDGPSVVNMVKHNNSSSRANGSNTKGSKDGSSNPLKGQSMFNKSHQIYYVTYVSEDFFMQDDDGAWWVDSGATGYVCKDRCWFKTYESLNDGSIIHMGNESTAFVHGCGCVDLRAAVRLPDLKLKTLGERGIECIFVGYAKHSKAFRFYVIEPNDSVSINSITEARDAIFNEHRFVSVPRLSQRSLVKGTEDSGGSVVSEREQEMSSLTNTLCYNVKDDPKTFDEAIKSQDVAFWKEAINNETDSIMRNNTWLLTDLPPGFKQKSGIDYFNTYTPMARISTIRLLIAMASIHSLIIHQMDVKIAFLNEELEEEAPKQWHQKFDEEVLSNGYLLNQADKCMYSKFDTSGKGVIICLYVDDILIFGTDQVQVDLTKEFLSSRFSMKDMGEADVILGIRIKHASNGIEISQSHYIEKVLKKFNYSDCTPVSIPLDTYEKLMPNRGYSQMYNGKSRHLSVRHSMIRELIKNGVVSIEFVRTPNSLLRKISRMCLESARKENEVANISMGSIHTGIWGWRYGVYTQRSLNTLTQIVVERILVADELQIPSEGNPSEEVSSAGYLFRGYFSIELSAGMLLSGLADASRH
nr:zinc finger, CCHC-type [Tanacetum cinerariifolium]